MMPSARTPHSRFDLRQTTERLRTLLDTLLSSVAPQGAPPRAATPREMSMLLSELLQAGERLRQLTERQRSEIEPDLASYGRQVERLRSLLPSLEAVLLAERARLELERDRLNATAEWIRASSQTL